MPFTTMPYWWDTSRELQYHESQVKQGSLEYPDKNEWKYPLIPRRNKFSWLNYRPGISVKKFECFSRTRRRLNREEMLKIDAEKTCQDLNPARTLITRIKAVGIKATKFIVFLMQRSSYGSPVREMFTVLMSQVVMGRRFLHLIVE